MSIKLGLWATNFFIKHKKHSSNKGMLFFAQ
jgi:hypothetical protein